MGPTLIFDKSLLNGINPSNALWMDSLYTCNITPLLYVETLADLYKPGRPAKGDRSAATPEQVVGKLAAKTPQLHQVSNVFHETIIYNELCHGLTCKMDTRPFPANGRQVKSGDQMGVIIESPEIDALHRWHQGDFMYVERQYAKNWRAGLDRYDLRAMKEQFRPFIRQFSTPTSPETALLIAQQLLRDPFLAEWNMVSIASKHLPYSLLSDVMTKWGRAGSNLLPSYASYSAHVRLVDLFFMVLLSSDLIQKNPNKSSNVVDASYLYYLPFCEVFVSGDLLHGLMVPPLIQLDQRLMGTQCPKQAFITKDDFKADLEMLDKYFNTLSDELKAQGAYNYASVPPDSTDYLTTRLWNIYRPRWNPKLRYAPRDSPEDKQGDARKVEKYLLEYIRKQMHEAKDIDQPVDSDQTDFIHINRSTPSRIAGYQMFSDEQVRQFETARSKKS